MSHVAIIHAFKVVAETLAPLNETNQRRVLDAVAVLLALKPTTVVRAHAHSDGGLPTRVAVLLETHGGELRVAEIAALLGAREDSVGAALSRCVRDGTARRVRQGVYLSEHRDGQSNNGHSNGREPKAEI